MNRTLAILWLALLLMATPAARAAAQQDEDRLTQLVEQIARGDQAQAAEAAEEFIELAIGPAARALGAIEGRPVAEQERLYRVMGRLGAALRVRLARASLPDEDRKLFDSFAARYAGLVERLFDDRVDVRLAAMRQIPLEPGTPAGVLIVTKLYDGDGDVIAEALKLAARLKDQVVVRGLLRFVRQVLDEVRAGRFQGADRESEYMYIKYAQDAIVVLADARAKPAVPLIVEALESFTRDEYEAFWDAGVAAAALGKLGDESAAPVLLRLIEVPKVRDLRALKPGVMAKQTVGDAALHALLTIYGLDPGAFGFYEGEPPGRPVAPVDAAEPAGAQPLPWELHGTPFYGFTDDTARQKAVQRFRVWHQANSGKPRAQREKPAAAPAATQPAAPSQPTGTVP